MKSTTTARKGQVAGQNLAKLDELIKALKGQPEQFGCLRLIADMFDGVAKGQNLYMVIGSTKDHTAFSLFVKGDLEPDGLYAASLEDLNTLANDLV